jgi:hypothetical protein
MKALLVAGIPAVFLGVFPKLFADMGLFDISWISDYSWFIGCGLGYAAFVLFERLDPRVPTFDGESDGVSDGTLDGAAATAAAEPPAISAEIPVAAATGTTAGPGTREDPPDQPQHLPGDDRDHCGRRPGGGAKADAEIVAVCPEPGRGPAAVESHVDEVAAAAAVVELVRADLASGGSDAYVLACFGDPGLDAARELVEVPVIGIAEAAMHVAAIAGRRFAIVTTLGRTLGRARDLVARYGMDRACAQYRAVEIPVLALEEPDEHTLARIERECRAALDPPRSGRPGRPATRSMRSCSGAPAWPISARSCRRVSTLPSSTGSPPPWGSRSAWHAWACAPAGGRVRAPARAETPAKRRLDSVGRVFGRRDDAASATEGTRGDAVADVSVIRAERAWIDGAFRPPRCGSSTA